MASSSIPRFLLPQRGLIWRRAAADSAPPSTTNRQTITLRRLASTKPGGPRVLEKPERFNPPSHGARLPKKQIPRYYGGELSEAEVKVQAQKDYPMTMPAKGSFAHWFLTSRWIHMVITVGSLTSLAIYTMVLNFKSTTPFADFLPEREDLLRHPIQSTRMIIDVVKMTEAHKTQRIQEKRKRAIEDVAKRAEYRKAHGLPEEMGLFNMKRATINMGDEKPADAAAAAAVVDDASPVAPGEDVVPAAPVAPAKKRNEPVEVRRLTPEEQKAVVESTKGKWLGVF